MPGEHAQLTVTSVARGVCQGVRKLGEDGFRGMDVVATAGYGDGIPIAMGTGLLSGAAGG